MNEKEVGVSVNHAVTVSYQCDADMKKAIENLKYIKQSILHRDGVINAFVQGTGKISFAILYVILATDA